MTLRNEEPHVNKCFPRVRGDVPRTLVQNPNGVGFSPRARGCSHLFDLAEVSPEVFPACAGMFPARFTGGESVKRFPRVRGDVPTFSLSVLLPRRFSPRARGCSASTVSFDVASWVFPACAGMFLSPLGRCSMVRPFSPRARGCSLVGQGGFLQGYVFPACAGMFPHHMARNREPHGFPRVRGDVPPLC